MLSHLTVPASRRDWPARPDTVAAGPVRVLVVHATELVRTGLVELLRADRVCDVSAGVGSVYEAFRVSSAVPPRAILFEYAPRGGLEAARLLASLAPRPRLIALISSAGEAFASDPLGAGVDGVVVMDGASRQSFVAAVRSVLLGNIGVVAGVAGRVWGSWGRQPVRGHGLTPRERELLYLIGEGLTNREIADMLTLSVKTVETHRANLSRKLGLRSRAGLMRLAIGIGAEDGTSAGHVLAPGSGADA